MVCGNALPRSTQALNAESGRVGMENGFPYGPTEPTEVLLDRLIQAIEPLTPSAAWLLLATLEGTLPTADRVRTAVRAAALDGPIVAIRQGVWSGPLPRYLDAGPWHPVRIVAEQVIVDVHHTAQTDFATGIQRVTREATRRWVNASRPTLVGWTPADEFDPSPEPQARYIAPAGAAHR